MALSIDMGSRGADGVAAPPDITGLYYYFKKCITQNVYTAPLILLYEKSSLSKASCTLHDFAPI
jgi:hypothetical protein